jgi:hypothetical protein
VTTPRETLRLGFLTTLEQPADCFIGGLLVTNHLGRPLEFQCTTPVKPNATQKILYGPTLRPFVLTELIGRTLLDRAEVKPDVILVTDSDLLGLRDLIDRPVACLNAPDDVPGSSGDSEEFEWLALGHRKIRFHDAHSDDKSVLMKRSHLLPAKADWAEPFERVRDALREVTVPGGAR